MKKENLLKAFDYIARIMAENRDYLIKLDQQNGDGDLGISMSQGFKAVSEFLNQSSETDLGRLLHKASQQLNESAPSSLGTILSFSLLGMAKQLKGKDQFDLQDIAEAINSGISLIMEKAGSKPGEKTILDSLHPAAQTLLQNIGEDTKLAFEKAAKAAEEGAEETKNMRSVHGRAAYYGDKSIGVLDGGAVVGSLIFKAILESLDS